MSLERELKESFPVIPDPTLQNQPYKVPDSFFGFILYPVSAFFLVAVESFIIIIFFFFTHILRT